MKQKGHFAIPIRSEKDQTITVMYGAGEPGPSEGTGIPPGQEGIAPPSIFEQPFVRGKKRKRLGRSPGALGGKVVNRKKGKSVSGSKSKMGDIEYVTKQSKKHGGKITYKMTGGQVVDAGYE